MQNEGIKSKSEYFTWLKDNPEKKKEYNMPYNPQRVYDEWKDFYTFFGKPTSTKDPNKIKIKKS